MFFDVLLVVMVGFLAFSGFRRGSLESGLRLAGLPLAYGAAALAAIYGGDGVAARLDLPAFVGAAIVGMLAFVLVYAVIGMAALKARNDADYIPMSSRWVGTGLGLARGLLLAVPLLWMADLVEGARASGLQPSLPDLSTSLTRAAAEPVFEAGGKAFIDENDPSSRMAGRFLADPGKAVSAAQDVLGDDRFRVLQTDAAFWEDIERGAITHAVARPTFQELASDPALREKLGALGLVSPEATRDAGRFETEIVHALAQVAPRLATIRNDPALARLLEDPEVQYMVEKGDALALLRHPEFRALVSRVSEDTR